MPQVGEDRDTAPLELGSLRVLVLVDHVLVDALEHQHPGLRLHPGGDERGKVQPGAAVEQELVVDELIRDIGRHRIVRQPIARGPHALSERGVRLADERVRVRITSGLSARGASMQWHPVTMAGRRAADAGGPSRHRAR
jgi:hypothetical protein